MMPSLTAAAENAKPAPGGAAWDQAEFAVMRHFSVLPCLILISTLPCAARAIDAPHRGGTLRLASLANLGTIDPQINYTSAGFRIYPLTVDGLLTFRKSGGDTSMDIVPDLAEAMPEIRDGGTTYIFKLRRGIKFSNGHEVTLADIRASFIRIFKVLSPNAQSWYSIIKGGDACVASPENCTLHGGVETDPVTNSVTIHTMRPSGEFLYQLAMPFAGILPSLTPPHDLGTTPPITTGAYIITSYDPAHGLTLTRNPYFHQWSADAQPDGYADRIEMRFGLGNEDEVNEVINGDIDYMDDFIPLDRLADLAANHTALVHIDSMPAYYFIAMNVREPPFTSRDVRRAVAMAVSRRALINLYGGPAVGRTICHMLPHDIPGSVPYCPFSKPPGPEWVAPDMAAARALVQKSGFAGSKITFISSDDQVEAGMGLYLQSVLNALGFDTKIRTLSTAINFTYMQNSHNHMQIGLGGWYQDFPHPADFLYVLGSCASFHPGSDASINIAEYCNPPLDRKMDRALALGATDPVAANALWAEADHDMTDDAPYAPLFEMSTVHIVSARAKNILFSKIYQTLLGKIWLQ
jgi:peptide/nickel transport system substrate-binding protein